MGYILYIWEKINSSDETDNEDDNENYEREGDRLLAEMESLSDRIID